MRMVVLGWYYNRCQIFNKDCEGGFDHKQQIFGLKETVTLVKPKLTWKQQFEQVHLILNYIRIQNMGQV